MTASRRFWALPCSRLVTERDRVTADLQAFLAR